MYFLGISFVLGVIVRHEAEVKANLNKVSVIIGFGIYGCFRYYRNGVYDANGVELYYFTCASSVL